MPAKTPSPTTKAFYKDKTHDELVIELIESHQKITDLEKKLSKIMPKAAADPKVAAEKLRTIAIRGIKSQMKWKPSCKRSNPRWSWASLCDEGTFKEFLKIPAAEKAKGRKMKIEDFQNNILGKYISASIRYGSLEMKGENVNITYGASGEIKISGSYGM